MTSRTIKIELKVDFTNPEKDEVIREAAKVAAKHLLTTAMLISDKRKPSVAVMSEDFFDGVEEISLAEDIPE